MPYNAYRKYVGLPPARTFAEINSDPEIQRQLNELYGTPYRVDRRLTYVDPFDGQTKEARGRAHRKEGVAGELGGPPSGHRGCVAWEILRRAFGVTHDRLMLEDHADVFPVSLEAAKKAVSKLAFPEALTLLNPMDENVN